MNQEQWKNKKKPTSRIPFAKKCPAILYTPGISSTFIMLLDAHTKK